MDKLKLFPLACEPDELAPAMSKDTLIYHYDTLARNYVNNFNNGIGDSYFNISGATLHNIFFQQFKPFDIDNKPFDDSVVFVEHFYGNLDQLKTEMKNAAMHIQGSGWVYLASDGKIKTIKNHEMCSDIILLIDWWEHAWTLDYRADKDKYFDNIWSIIDWSVINKEIRNKV